MFQEAFFLKIRKSYLKNIVKAIWQQNKTNNDFNVVKANEKLENSFIKKQYNENGIILEIEHPEKIIPNSYVNFKITMTNNLPYIGTKGGVSISFPQFGNKVKQKLQIFQFLLMIIVN